jgi:branched-chain amino acid aminotransferase
MSQGASLGFGNYFTPHMAVTRWSASGGWSPVEVVGHLDLALPPSALALHYGQAIFEGIKAYARPAGSASLFRPARSARRFNRSAARMSMPAVPEEMFMDACEAVVRADITQVPTGPGQSLYLRPVMIATEPSLNVRAAREYLFFVIASPADSFFAADTEGINAWCSADYVRAVAGGTGEAKCAGNYAAGMAAKAAAVRHGCQEVLWLDALEHRWVEELSAMNFCCLFRDANGATELVTPPLTGAILDGNTRDSILRLAARRKIMTTERPVSLTELIDPSGAAAEAFACGTAATVVPITRITMEDGGHQIGAGRPGALTLSLRDELIAIQEGRAADEFKWMHEVLPAATVSTSAGSDSRQEAM